MDPESKERLEALHADFAAAVDGLAISVASVGDWLRSGHKARPEQVRRLLDIAAELTSMAHNAPPPPDRPL